MTPKLPLVTVLLVLQETAAGVNGDNGRHVGRSALVIRSEDGHVTPPLQPMAAVSVVGRRWNPGNADWSQAVEVSSLLVTEITCGPVDNQ